MQNLVPPPLPPKPFLLSEDDGLRRLNFRLWQILYTAITLVITLWFVTMGPIPAILAIMVAKHVLVAVLVRGLDVNISPREPPMSG
jgi:hypothetical protein